MCPATTLPPEDQPMRAVILLSTVCLTGFAATAVAQRPAKPKPAAPQAAVSTKPTIAGAWAMENTVKTAAGKDTVVKSLVTATPGANGWVTHLAGVAVTNDLTTVSL